MSNTSRNKLIQDLLTQPETLADEDLIRVLTRWQALFDDAPAPWVVEPTPAACGLPLDKGHTAQSRSNGGKTYLRPVDLPDVVTRTARMAVRLQHLPDDTEVVLHALWRRGQQ